jgi:hypothetical protein
VLLVDPELSNHRLPKMRPGKNSKLLVLLAINPQARNMWIEASVQLPFHFLISAGHQQVGQLGWALLFLKLAMQGSSPMDSVASLLKRQFWLGPRLLMRDLPFLSSARSWTWLVSLVVIAMVRDCEPVPSLPCPSLSCLLVGFLWAFGASRVLVEVWSLRSWLGLVCSVGSFVSCQVGPTVEHGRGDPLLRPIRGK